MVKKATKKRVAEAGQVKKKTTASGSANAGIGVWHPLVHERFGESLYYLLVAVKPFERPDWDKEVSDLMSKFGIPSYCSYQLFGSFDCMLRVWLPPAEAGRFKTEAAKISNVRSVLELSVRVADKRLCWINEEVAKLGLTNAEIKAEAIKLTQDDIQRVQNPSSDSDIAARQFTKNNELRRKGLLIQRPVDTAANQLKAFISFSEPDSTINDRVRQVIMGRLEDLLKEETYCFEQPPTLMVGVGFCWALVKVIANSYVALGKFINDVSDKFSPYGISSNTFLVFGDPSPIEGDSVCTLALGDGHNTEVAQFLPRLYEVELSNEEKGRFEDFILKDLLRYYSELTTQNTKDRHQLLCFLDAVLLEDRDAAFLALYPTIRAAESQLREPLGAVCAQAHYPGGVPALLEFLKQDKQNPPRSFKELTLRDSMQAGRELLKHALPTDPWVRGLSDKDFERISNIRNTVMHDKPLNLREEWRDYSRIMLKLFEIRDQLQIRYDELRQEYSDESNL